MQHFIRVYTVCCKTKSIFKERNKSALTWGSIFIKVKESIAFVLFCWNKDGDTRHIQQIHIDQPFMHPSPYIIIIVALNSYNNPALFWMRIYYDHQLCLLFQWHVCEIDRYTQVNKWSITIEYIFLSSWCTIKTTIWQSSLFLSDVWCLLWLLQPLPPQTQDALNICCICLYLTCHCPKGILGLGGESI